MRTYSGVTRRSGYRWLVLFDPQFAIDLKREGAFTSNVCGLKIFEPYFMLNKL